MIPMPSLTLLEDNLLRARLFLTLILSCNSLGV